MRSCQIVAAGALAASLCAAPAGAHPHMWFDAEAAFILEDGRLAAIEVTYLVDELNTLDTLLSLGLDPDSDGVLTDAERAALAEAFHRGMRQYRFFAEVSVGAEEAIQFEAAEAVEADVRDFRIFGRFVLSFDAPVEVSDAGATLALYDPEYFTEVRMLSAPEVRASVDAGCGVAFRPFEPDAASVQQQLMLALLLQERPPADAGIGAAFSDRAVLTCSG